MKVKVILIDLQVSTGDAKVNACAVWNIISDELQYKMYVFSQGHKTSSTINDFLTLLTVCHTVIPEVTLHMKYIPE